MFETIKEKPRAYEQWELWRNGVFGGLPWRAVLSSSPLESATDDKKTIQRLALMELELNENRMSPIDYRLTMTEGFFLLASIKSNFVLPEDENEKITLPDKTYSPMFDGQVQYQQDLFFDGDYLTSSTREIYEPKNYHITQQSVALYLESFSIKEEAIEQFASLVSLVCDYLNRDKKRMESAQEHIIRKKELIDSKNANDLFLEAYKDRASTIAQIDALCSGKVIPPFKEENEPAEQESATESKIETHSVEPPEEIQKRFKKFVEDGILNTFPEPIDGRIRYYLKGMSANDFFDLFKKEQYKKQLPQIPASVLKEWIYKNDGEPYSHYSFYKHY